jgi:transcription elongation factor GreA-like protein/transcription elongation GreA/GreB family factor
MTNTLKNHINAHRQKAEWEEVIPIAQDILAKEPGDLSALRSLAEAHEKLDELDQAIDIWRILVDRHHEITPYARKLGLALKAQGDAGAKGYIEQALLVAIDRKHMAEVEELWIEMIDLENIPASAFLDYSRRLAGRREKDRAGELLLIYVESAALPAEDRLLCMRAVVEYLPERQIEFRSLLAEAYKGFYASRPDLEKLMDLAKIQTADSLFSAMVQLDRYLKFGEGQFFYHNGWGAGKIRKIDPALERVIIDFAKKKEHVLTLEMADKSLAPIQPNDLRALWLENEDKVRKQAESDPVGLVKSALISMNGKANAKEIKDALLNHPIPETGWTKWWTAVNKRLKDDHYIEVSGGSLKTYVLREQAEGPDEEYERRFRETRTLRGRLDLFSDYRSHRATDCNADLLSRMAHDLVSKASNTRADSEAVETVFMVQDLGEMTDVKHEHLDQIIEPILRDLDRAVNALEGLKNATLQARCFRLMEDNLHEEVAKAYERLMFDGPDSIRDLVAEHVAKNHEEGVLAQLFRKVRPIHRDEAGLFVWFAQRFLTNRPAAEDAGITRPMLVEHLIGLHEVLGYRVRTSKKDASGPLRATMSDIRQLLKRTNLKLLREVLTETDAPTARLLWKTNEHAVGMEDRVRKEITGYLGAHFGDILSGAGDSASSAAGTVPIPNRLLCLGTSLERKREELRRIKEVEVPKNTRDIESARALGDLSENAEYHAAKERQGTLLTLSGKLQQELASASAIREEDFSTAMVGFGSQIRLRQGEIERTIVILGPWESNPDADILSFESPLGKVLWGKRPGDTFEFTMSGTQVAFEVLSIEAWKAPHPA